MIKKLRRDGWRSKALLSASFGVRTITGRRKRKMLLKKNKKKLREGRQHLRARVYKASSKNGTSGEGRTNKQEDSSHCPAGGEGPVHRWWDLLQADWNVRGLNVLDKNINKGRAGVYNSNNGENCLQGSKHASDNQRAANKEMRTDVG